MRILVVGINYAPDLIGVAKYNTELCEALAAAGHEVRIVTAPPYYPRMAHSRRFPGMALSARDRKGCRNHKNAHLCSRQSDGRETSHSSRHVCTHECVADHLKRC